MLAMSSFIQRWLLTTCPYAGHSWSPHPIAVPIVSHVHGICEVRSFGAAALNELFSEAGTLIITWISPLWANSPEALLTVCPPKAIEATIDTAASNLTSHRLTPWLLSLTCWDRVLPSLALYLHLRVDQLQLAPRISLA